ncbi:DNA polymerase Y family protein [Streptomyces carpaticus]|uniref:DNA polymerase Y family protein n=1 Tax=Streptomyces carpaticus TaxID=285558 RepID=UPI003D2F7879
MTAARRRTAHRHPAAPAPPPEPGPVPAPPPGPVPAPDHGPADHRPVRPSVARAVLHIRFHGHPTEERYTALLDLLHGISPVVQALPPDAALVDVSGARRYFGREAAALAGLIRVRALALHGTDTTIGVAANPLLARMAGQQGGGRGVHEVTDAAAFLAPLPPAALHGVGAATARALTDYGLDTVERIDAAPAATLQRILGAAPARRLRTLARGIDPTPVTPAAPPRSLRADHRFPHDELDPGHRRAALLALADDLGYRLRDTGQTARTLTLTVRYADRSTTTRSRTLPEPTAHTPALVAAGYALHDALGLQRARVRTLSLRADDLGAAEDAHQQLTLDPRDERRRAAEAAADRARRRFGAGAVGPAGAGQAAASRSATNGLRKTPSGSRSSTSRRKSANRS